MASFSGSSAARRSSSQLRGGALTIFIPGKTMGVSNKSWVVRVRCSVVKELIVTGCSKETASLDPFGFAEQEREIEQSDYEVISVKPNE